MSKKLTQRWFIVLFDRNWVVCRGCRTEFLAASVERRNKCPRCGLDNYCERTSKWVEKTVKGKEN